MRKQPLPVALTLRKPLCVGLFIPCAGTNLVIRALVTSRLGYYNWLCLGLSLNTVQKLQFPKFQDSSAEEPGKGHSQGTLSAAEGFLGHQAGAIDLHFSAES